MSYFQQSLDRNDVAQIKRQLEALGDAVVARKQDHEQLQDKVQALVIFFVCTVLGLWGTVGVGWG